MWLWLSAPVPRFSCFLISLQGGREFPRKLMQAVCVTQGAVHALLTRVAQDCREHSSYLPQSYPAEFFFPLLTKRVAADCDCWRAACSEPANDSSCENPALPRQQ